MELYEKVAGGNIFSLAFGHFLTLGRQEFGSPLYLNVFLLCLLCKKHVNNVKQTTKCLLIKTYQIN